MAATERGRDGEDDSLVADAVERAAALDDYLGGFAPPTFDGRPRGGDDPRAPAADVAGLVDAMLVLRQAAAGDGVVPATGAEPMPATIGRHAILRLAGTGGCATVWEGFDTLLHRPVAVKVRRPELLLSESARRRFVREAEIAARLVHPHIVTIFEVGEDHGREFIAAEFCPGGSLAGWLERHPGPLPPRVAARLVRALAGAVAAAHDAGVVHRDIKPANVLLAPAPVGTEPVLREPAGGTGPGLTVKLADFGLGKLRDDGDASDPLTPLTRTGTSIGTPAWMAPEQIDRSFGAVGPATDVHALGLLLDRLLTGRPLRGASTTAKTYHQVLCDEPPSADRSVRGVPADLAAIALTCLAKQPADRYASVAALAEDLDRFLDGRPTMARPLSSLGRAARWMRRRPLVAGLGAAAAVATCMVAVLAVHHLSVRRAAVSQQVQLLQQSAVTELRRGFEAIGAGNVAKALEQLAATRALDPHLADSLAGRWLVRRTHGERAILLSATTAAAAPHARRELYALALAPDGATAAAAGADGRVRLLRNLAGSPTVSTVAAHDEVNAVAFSPSGTMLVSAGQDGRLRWWRVTETGLDAAGDTVPDGRPLYAAAFAPDGRSIATGGEGRVVTIVNLDAPDRPVALFEFEPPEGESPEVESLVFVDEHTIAASCGDRIVLLDAREGRVVREFESPEPHNHNAVLGSLGVSADGRRLVACGTTRQPHVWDVETGRIVAWVPEHPAWVQGCCFLPDGRRLATACRDGIVRVFDMETAGTPARLVGHEGRVWCVVAEPGGTLLTCGADGTVRRWDPAADFATASLRNLPVQTAEIIRLAAGPDGTPGVIATDAAGKCWQLSVADGTPRAIGRAAGKRLLEIDTDVPRRRVAVSSRDKATVDVLDLAAPDEPAAVPLPDGFDPCQAVPCWTPDGELVVCSRSGSVCIVSPDLADAIPIVSPLDDPVHQIAIAPAGIRRVAVAGKPSAIVPLPPRPGAGPPPPPIVLDVGEEASSVAWSPDGALLACGTRSGRVLLCDGVTGAIRGTLVPHERDALTVAFSRDGRILVSADSSCLRISDVATRTTLDEIRPAWHVNAVWLAADDDCLVLGGTAPGVGGGGDGRLAVMPLDQP